MVESMDTSRHFQGGGALIDAANGAAQDAGCDKHAFGIPDVDWPAALVVGELLNLQKLAHRLRDKPVASRQQHHEAVAELLVDEHLAKSSNGPRPALVRLCGWDIEQVYLRALGCRISRVLRVLTTTDSFLRKGEVNILFTYC